MKINEFDNSKDNVPITKKDAALYKQAQHMVMKSKVDYKPSVDTMVSVNKQMRDYVGNLDKDATKLSKAAGIPRDAVKPPKPLTQRSGNFSQFGKTENAVKEAGVGKIVKGVNTTPDVQPGETERQAKKLFPMNKNGKPNSLGVKGATPNQAFNLGLTENMSVTGTERRRAEKKKGLEIGSPEWFKHWFDLPYLREDISKQELLAKLKDQQRGRYIKAMLDAMHRLVKSKGTKHSIGSYAFEIAKVFGFNGKELEKMYRDMYMVEDITTTNKQGVTTTVDKKANRITTQSGAGTVVKDRSGNIRSVSTPRVGGFQATQTFRPDSTPGYQQANYKGSGGIDLDVKGSPETGYTNTAKASIGGFGVGVKQRYDGSQQNTVDYTLGQGKKVGITQNIPKPKQKLNMSEGIQKVDVEQLEKFADRLFGKVGIDVEFTRHFMDRVNDVRNQKPITMSELTRLFKQEYKRWGKPIAQMGPNSQAVMKDLQTNINLPFVLKWDDKNNELDLIAKTVMRKQDFKTPNKEFPVENAPGSLAQKINWGSQNKPIKKNTSSGSSGNNQQLAWWQKIKQKVMGEDVEKLDLKKKFEITDELNKLSNIFNRGGHEIRIVGGAVRDLALDKTPKDIDLATDATPDEMQQMFDSAGVRHIPTGIEHGTITAVINGEEFEVTTLRADKETDGRRAEVEFVRSWEEDAKRRDLTYNAMSMDFEGNLYDYHGGMDDLQDKVTRFVGDPEERIKEDYLRTLRYFRFQGRLDTPTFDRETMSAIANNTDGLKQLSVERVWMEMGKILGGSNIQQILSAMDKTGVLDAIGLNTKPSQDIMDGGDPIINLARITDDESIGTRWKMSNEEKGKLGFLISEKGKTHDKEWYTNMMVDGFDRTQLDALARYNNQDDMIAHIKSFKAPEFPVGGNDLLKLGHERGPKIGQTLNALRAQWKAGNFSASKDELLKSLSEKITKRTPMGDVIDDFQKSDAPQFKGKSKAKRRQMAIAAKLSKMDENFIVEGIMLRLERDYNADMLVLHVKDTKTDKRTEVRGKLGYESGGYDEEDKLHQLLDKIGKAANISDLMNGEIVHINPKHPKGPESIKTATKLANENFADGKKPGRKGLSKRVGIPKDATIAQLEKIAKNSTGERRRMAQWQLNMRRGKNKKK